MKNSNSTPKRYTDIKTRRDLIAALEASPTVTVVKRGNAHLFTHRPKRGPIGTLWVWPDGTMHDAQADLAIAKCVTIDNAVSMMGLDQPAQEPKA